MTNRLSVYSADMPRNGPIEGSLRRLPGMEALELLALLKWITAKSASAGDARRSSEILVPALVELPFESVDPLFGDMMWRVGCAGRVVDEERSVGRYRLLFVDVFDCL